MEGGKNVNSALSLSQKAASYVSRNFVYRDGYGAKKSNLWKIDIRAGVERHLARFPSSSISGVNPEHIFCIYSSAPCHVVPTDRPHNVLALGGNGGGVGKGERERNCRLIVSEHAGNMETTETTKQTRFRSVCGWVGAKEGECGVHGVVLWHDAFIRIPPTQLGHCRHCRHCCHKRKRDACDACNAAFQEGEEDGIRLSGVSE